MPFSRRWISAAYLLFACVYALAADLKPEEIVQKHLASIGTPEARAAAKTRVIQAPATYRILVGGSGQSTARLSSSSRSARCTCC